MTDLQLSPEEAGQALVCVVLMPIVHLQSSRQCRVVLAAIDMLEALVQAEHRDPRLDEIVRAYLWWRDG